MKTEANQQTHRGLRTFSKVCKWVFDCAIVILLFLVSGLFDIDRNVARILSVLFVIVGVCGFIIPIVLEDLDRARLDR